MAWMDWFGGDNAAGLMQGCHYTGANISNPWPHLAHSNANATPPKPTPPRALMGQNNLLFEKKVVGNNEVGREFCAKKNAGEVFEKIWLWGLLMKLVDNGGL